MSQVRETIDANAESGDNLIGEDDDKLPISQELEREIEEAHMESDFEEKFIL